MIPLAGPVVLPLQVEQAVAAHVRGCLPEEACGLLAVDAGGAVRFAYPLTNADRSPVTYTVAPAEHFGAVRHAERHGWEVAGGFHSHPTTEPVPSPTDIARAPATEWLHLIAGIEAERITMRGFLIAGGEVSEVPVLVSPRAVSG